MKQSTNDGARAGRGFLVIAAAKIYFILASYAIQLALPRLLGEMHFGRFSTVLPLVSVVNNVVVVATIQTVSRFNNTLDTSPKQVLRFALKIQAALGAMLAFGFFATADLMATQLRDPSLTPLIRIVSLVIFSYSLYATFVGSLNGQQKFGTQAKLDMTFSTLRTVGMIGGAAALTTAFGTTVGFTTAATLITATAAFVMFRDREDESSSAALPPNMTKQWLAFALPIFVYHFFQNALLLIDIQVLKATSAEHLLAEGAAAQVAADKASELVGIYRAAQTFALVPYQLLLAMTFVLFPMITKATKSDDEAGAKVLVNMAFRTTLIMLFAVATPIAACAEGVMLLAFPESFLAGATSLRILIFGAVAFTFYVMAATVLNGIGKQWWATGVAAIGAIAVLAIDRWLLISNSLDSALLFTPLGTSSSMLLAALLSCALVFARFRTLMPLFSLIRVAIAAALVYIGLYSWAPNGKIETLLALIIGGLSYLGILFAIREIRRADINALLKLAGR